MKKEKVALRVLYVLAVYVLLQLVWWGYQLIQLNAEIILSEQTDLNVQYLMLRKKVWMVAGEGVVFFVLLAIGFRYIKRTVSSELAQARREKNFLLAVTHELKTPIAAVKLFLETMQSRAIDEEKKKLMTAQALQETKRLQSLTENILLATRMDQQQTAAELTSLNFTELVQREVERFQRLYPARLEAAIADGISVLGDDQMLSALVVNLLDNAFKYGGNESPVKLKLQHTENKMLLTVADAGKGISAAERKNIFRMFYRSGNEETRSSSGTGLGLFIVAAVAKLHKAEIDVSDNQPRGTIFAVKMNVIQHEA
ncbi:MAG: sensor histidine kinase [Flavobacteriales bacterium]|jgi:signal transduction histidine kinase